MNKKKWYDNVYIMLFVFWPRGIYLLWKDKSFSQNKKILITTALGICGLVVLVAPQPDNKETPATAKAKNNSQTKTSTTIINADNKPSIQVSKKQLATIESQKKVYTEQDFSLGHVMMIGEKTPIKTLLVSGDNYTMNNKPAVSIMFSGQNNYNRIDSTASFDGKMYFQSAKHYSYIEMFFSEVDFVNKSCFIQTTGVYVEPTSGKSLSFSAEINISDNLFDKLQLDS